MSGECEHHRVPKPDPRDIPPGQIYVLDPYSVAVTCPDCGELVYPFAKES